MDFATVVTEDSDIFTSCTGKTDVRGKRSQFEAAFNFIRHYAIPYDDKDKTHVVCIDSDLKGKRNNRNMKFNKNTPYNTIKSTSMHANQITLSCHWLKLSSWSFQIQIKRMKLLYAASTFPIMHLICHPKFGIRIVFNFSWDGCNNQEKWKTKVMQNFGGQIRCILGNMEVAYEVKLHFKGALLLQITAIHQDSGF